MINTDYNLPPISYFQLPLLSTTVCTLLPSCCTKYALSWSQRLT